MCDPVQQKKLRLLRGAEEQEARLRSMPEDVPQRTLASLLFLGVGEYEKALFHADVVLKHSPDYTPAFLHKLDALAHLRRWHEIDSLRQSDHAFRGGEASIRYAQATMHLGNINTARAEYARVSAKTRRYYRDAVRDIETRLAAE